MKHSIALFAALLVAPALFAQTAVPVPPAAVPPAGTAVAGTASAIQAALEDGKALDGPKEWTTTFSFGGSITRGNKDTLVANTRLATEKLVGDNLFNGSAEAAYGEAEQTGADGASYTEKNIDNAKLLLGYKRRFGKPFLFVDGLLLTDDIADIDYRAMPSAGAGAFLADTGAFRLSAQAGVGFLREQVDGVTDNYATYLFGERATYALSETASLWEDVSCICSFDDSDDYLVTARIGADAAMTTTLKLGVVFQYAYDNTPAPGAEKEDLSLAVQLSLLL
ncbi:MAG: DUF481 domain-containing protein [Kiritimatiellia bacterium]|jgi:putative salt-induced outer membrane protein YdiY